VLITVVIRAEIDVVAAVEAVAVYCVTGWLVANWPIPRNQPVLRLRSGVVLFLVTILFSYTIIVSHNCSQK
jgi:hypothetical protein